jgi:hypothetical protein
MNAASTHPTPLPTTHPAAPPTDSFTVQAANGQNVQAVLQPGHSLVLTAQRPDGKTTIVVTGGTTLPTTPTDAGVVYDIFGSAFDYLMKKIEDAMKTDGGGAGSGSGSGSGGNHQCTNVTINSPVFGNVTINGGCGPGSPS